VILHLSLQIAAWFVALAWWSKLIPAVLNVPRIPDLHRLPLDIQPASKPTITVIVPAKNEEQSIRATIDSLLKQDYPNLNVIAIDDRSTDTTGILMDELVVERPHRLRVLHIKSLPPGWTGKVHAMATAARESTSDWLLFTDGDVEFAPNAIRLSLAMAEQTDADHLVTVPTMTVKRWDEGMLLGYFQIFSLWAARPWRVADPKAKRDTVGIGAFNMVRRSAYQSIGGFDSMPMEVLEDMRLGRDIKLAGFSSRVVFGRGLVRVHWASGAKGLIHVMTKNLFSAFRFRMSIVLLACLWMTVFCVGPVVALMFSGVRIPAAATLAAIGLAYLLYARQSRLSPWYALLYPVAAVLFIYILLRSMIHTLRDGGVTWRETFYPLADLRAKAGGLW